MRRLKKVMGIIIGTVFVGLGVSLYKLSSLGQDPLSAMVFSIMYIFNNEFHFFPLYVDFFKKRSAYWNNN